MSQWLLGWKLNTDLIGLENKMFKDFKVKFIVKLDPSFILHTIREFILSFIIATIATLLGSNEPVIISFVCAMSWNTSWEWQDGIKTCSDGFNLLDWFAGLIGIGFGLLLHSYLF